MMNTIALLVPFIILYLILLVTALVDLIRHWNNRQVPVIWLIVIIFVSTIGPIIYFIFGRKDYQ
ncbi:PLDc N-terminal domain-containing protein [Listeria booriae]|uniref:Negative regulator of sigma-Y activity n=2 Tax=Listeria booriae TaxID=1552123 RepID=A0A7X0WEH3_9LIST|nr:PLDc N-terminal domain-containing protein [Listeria booriae]MBC1211251.1 negative regulator of sigma-Y activity [Listeria booriae]MBC1308404.1 negative regulator of sigma-Y activity [Listeria booriae]MBC1332536.1 negative regulator of sigma-Y activity [Listeria booriae]MBC2373251.1 negative regulator of sigma-Y activity [Listeria booriae]MBC2387936.1 negative regulator of sigma-Y activity [Listeria booriae]